MSRLLEPTDTAYLYVIGEPTGPYKLGFSAFPKSRCRALIQQTKRDLALLHWVEVPYKRARSI